MQGYLGVPRYLYPEKVAHFSIDEPKMSALSSEIPIHARKCWKIIQKEASITDQAPAAFQNWPQRAAQVSRWGCYFQANRILERYLISARYDFMARWTTGSAEKHYFRFNVAQGLQGVHMNECQKRSVIESATHAYLHHSTQKSTIQDCILNMSSKQGKLGDSYHNDENMKTYFSQGKQMSISK